jgi:C-terminal processing protease CtpA/Prc
MLRGPLGPCQLRVMRGDEELELTVERMDYTKFDHTLHRWHTLPGRAYRLLAPDVAYLALEGVKRDSVTTWIEVALAQDAQGLIIDCRAYPGDFPIFQLGGHLVSEDTPFVAFTVADKSNPGAFLWRDHVTSLSPIAPHFSRPVVILVDEISLSSAEYHALAFRAAPQAIVMGSTTAGADGNISRFSLPGGLSLAISGIGIYDAEHGPTQRVGIVPDVVRQPTIAGIRAGQDEVLAAAVEHILGRPASESEAESW